MPGTCPVLHARRLPGPVATVAAVLLSVTAAAAAEAPALADYILESWTTKDGLPSNVIWSLAQDREGYIWLGTNAGLVRFDGVRFVAVESAGGVALPRAPARAVFTSRDGALWAGFSEAGGVVRLKDGHLRSYDARDGLDRGVVNAIVEDAGGTIVAGTVAGLFALTGDHWEHVGAAAGLPETRVDSAYLDRTGALLVGTSAGIFRRPRGAAKFEAIDAIDDAPTFRGFSEDAQGTIWVSDPILGFRRLGEPRSVRRSADKGRGNRLIHDRDGDLWVATMGEGIWRVHASAANGAYQVEKARVLGARSIVEDRDGSIWAGAGDGLVRLTRPRVTPVTDLGLVSAVAASPDGSVWVSTVDELVRFAPGGLRVRATRPTGSINALYVDRSAAVWTVSSNRLDRITARGTSSLELPAASRLAHVNAIAIDRDGRLWLSDRDRGLFRWNTGAGHAPEPVAEHSTTLLFADSAGRVWFGTAGGRLGVADADGRTRYYGAPDGLSTGPYNAIFEDRGHAIWVGGSDGISRLDGERFVRVGDANRFRGGVIAIVEDDDGDLWLGTGSGIVCIRRRDVSVTSPHQVRYTLFDAADGLAGMPVRFAGSNVARSSDGRLWFVSGRGLTVVAPRTLKVPQPPARVKLEGALVDDQPIPLDAGAALAARTNRLQIDYTVLQPGSRNVRFRYRLDGFDGDWVEAGTRRQAIYTHLPPRTYRFQVVASNSDGTWSDVGASWDFRIRPTFYQTRWFAGVIALAAGLSTWAAWRLRVRRIRRQFAVLLGERVRLSRELHDTLLQSLVGVALQFDAAASHVETGSAAHQQLLRIRRQVEEYIREARHSIWNLRSPILTTRDLATALKEAGERATAGHEVLFQMHVAGTPAPSAPVVDEQLLRIGQESIINAVRHARASHVDVHLDYAPERVTLRVRDDGRGFPSDGPGPDTGHYGLVSMRERAEQVGARFTLTSAADAGTTVEVVVPAAAAH